MALKAGQTVWCYDHVLLDVVEGILISTDNMSGHDYHPTYLVEVENKGRPQVLQDWTFATKDKAEKCLMRELDRDIKEKKQELKRLEMILKQRKVK